MANEKELRIPLGLRQSDQNQVEKESETGVHGGQEHERPRWYAITGSRGLRGPTQ